MTLLEISYQRSKAKRAAAMLLDVAVDESRSLTISEQIKFDSLTAQIEELDAQFIQRESLRKMVS
ncbi:MAG: hypothetical protein WB919_09275 [Candidatus Sulfotelmatobacter sp.]